MIRHAYIHEYDLYDDMIEEIQMNESYVDNLVREYNMKCEEIKMMNLMESVDESYFTEGVVEKIEKIGEAVEKVIDKFMKMVDQIIDSFRQMLWNRKSDAQKIEMILDKHPNLSDDIKLAFQKGELDVKDIKSMQEVLDGTYDIINEMKKGKIEPSKAEQKFNSMIEKWEKFGKPIVEIAGGVTTVLTATKAIKNFYPDLVRNKLDGDQIKARAKELKAQMRIDLAKANPNDLTVAQTANRMINIACSKITNNLRGIQRIHNKFNNWITSFIKRNPINISSEQRKLETARKTTTQYNQILRNNH